VPRRAERPAARGRRGVWTTLRFCPRCGTNVDTEHSWSLPILILLLVLFTLIGLIYLAVRWKMRCPRCHLAEESMPPAVGMVMPAAAGYGMPYGRAYGASSPMPMAAVAPSQSSACPTCGAPLRYIQQYGRWWCDRESQYK